MDFDRLPLSGGSYSARSFIADAQRCVNYFPEENPQDSAAQTTFYQRAGYRPVLQLPDKAPVRGLFLSSQDTAYACCGQSFYSISGAWQVTKLGTLATPGTGQVSFSDNGTIGLLVDGSGTGYSVTLATGAFAPVVDPTGIFTGARRVDYLDTFLLFNIPGTNEFGSTLSNELVFDPLYFAGKVGFPDPLQTLIVNRLQLLLFGSQKSEIWYDAGNPQFPFARLPGAYIEHGICAPWSVASEDIDVYWLSRNRQGQYIVLRQRGYSTTRVSNHALEYAFQQASRQQSLVDAIGFTYQLQGHVFYQLTFPGTNMTWVLDCQNGAWHQEAWTDGNGGLNRTRANCSAFLNGSVCVGDWQNGTIYILDPDVYTDTLVPGGVPGPITCIRSFPHLRAARNEQGQMVELGSKQVQVQEFRADIECGSTPLNADGTPAQISLRWSINRGKSYGNAVLQSLGAPGQYNTWPKWGTLGMGRDFVFELSHSIAGPAPLQGAWVRSSVQNQ